MKQNEFIKPFYQKPWFIIVSCIVALLVIASVLNKKENQVKYDFSSSTPNSSSQTSQQQITDENKPNVKQTEPNIGIIVNTNTIIKIVRYENKANIENEFVKPKDGFKFLAFQIEVDNTNGKKKLSLFASGSFKLKDDENFVYEAKPIVGREPMFNPSNDILIGDIVKGWVTFEVPESTKYNKCKIRYDFLGNETDWILIR